MYNLKLKNKQIRKIVALPFMTSSLMMNG